MSTVYGIVKHAQGCILIDSELGRGTTIEVYLPLVDMPMNSEPKSSSSSKEMSGGNETIFVVEDELMVREITCEILVTAGYQVIKASNGREALQLLAEQPQKIDLLISDVVMPEMNGKEIAKLLVTQQPDMRVLFVSGYTADVLDSQGVQDAECDFMQKPFSPHKLAFKVRDILDRNFSSNTEPPQDQAVLTS